MNSPLRHLQMPAIQPSRRRRPLATLALCLTCAAALAQELPSASSLKALEQNGYLPLDAISTPLLHRLGNGDAGDDRTLLIGGVDALPPHLRQTGQDLRSHDEFVANSALKKLQPYLSERAQLLQQAQGWLVPVRVKLSPYDFKRNRFTMTLNLNIQVQGGHRDLHCLGSYGPDAKGQQVLCVEPVNWDRSSLAFEYLVVDREEIAATVRDDIQNNRTQFLFMLKKEGALRINKNRKWQLGWFGHQINEIQPARVQGLVAYDTATGRILTVTPMP